MENLTALIKSMAFQCYTRYKTIPTFASMYEQKDLEQEAWVAILEKNVTGVSRAKSVIWNRFRNLSKKARRRAGIAMEIPYNELSDDERTYYDNVAYSDYSADEDY